MMEKYLVEENEDIIHVYEPLEFKIDKNYQYIKKGKIFLFFSNLLYYGIAFPILTIFLATANEFFNLYSSIFLSKHFI